MVLYRDEPRSLILALLLMLEDLEVIDKRFMRINAHYCKFDRIVYLEYYLYCKSLDSYHKQQIQALTDEFT